MEQNKTMVDISELHKAWLAGFFDGEGHVSASFYTSGVPSLSIGISNNCKPILDELKSEFGGNVYLHAGRTYNWLVGGRKALPFLTAISPYIVLKKEEVNIAIMFCGLTKGRWNYSLQEDLVRRKVHQHLSEAIHRRMGETFEEPK